jgi:outer membrane protein TolC
MATSDDGRSTVPTVTAHHGLDDRHAEIARRAYQLYEQRGRAQGGDIDDWLLAERELGLARDPTTA